jgi:hypothetical protein
MRFDLSTFLKDIPYNAAIDSAYGRRTDDIPKRSLQFSPRLGFNWDVTGDQHNQVRGGVGLFVGTPAIRLARERVCQLRQRHHVPELHERGNTCSSLQRRSKRHQYLPERGGQ